MALEFEYDLIVLDLNLPGMDGIAILKSLRHRKPDVPVMILTARARVEDRALCLDTGADDYVLKPFPFSSCRRVCAHCCGAAICLRSRF
jgi:DNA-binding response OmpR family regulator